MYRALEQFGFERGRILEPACGIGHFIGLMPEAMHRHSTITGVEIDPITARIAKALYPDADIRVQGFENAKLADGFFEWQEYEGKNYPYYIRLKNQEPFAMAGLWDTWKDSKTAEVLQTYSVITVKANPLMEQIHNKKKRMPVILPQAHDRCAEIAAAPAQRGDDAVLRRADEARHNGRHASVEQRQQAVLRL